jgi:hypothetical protein
VWPARVRFAQTTLKPSEEDDMGQYNRFLLL